MITKKRHVPYKIKRSQMYRELLYEKKLFVHLRSIKPVIRSICSKDSFDRNQLSKKLPLKSLEGVYLSRVFDSADRDQIHWYGYQRAVQFERYELAYFNGKEKPDLILKIEAWCKDRLNFEVFPRSSAFQLVALICENIIHWQKKSRWDLNAPKDKAEDFIIELLEDNLYDWLCCIANDKEEFGVIREPAKLERALSKLRRSKARNHAEMLEVTHFYLSLFIELKFLILLEGEGSPYFNFTSAKKKANKKATLTNEATLVTTSTNYSQRYILGTFCWTIHQDISIVPFFPFDLKDRVDQNTYWNIIRRNSTIAENEVFPPYHFIYDKFLLFSPTKKKLCFKGLQSVLPFDFLCNLPIKYPCSLSLVREYGQISYPRYGVFVYGRTKWRKDIELFRTGHLFYVLNFHYQEYLDLVALDCYDTELNSEKHLIDGLHFIDYYALMEKSDEHAYRWGNLGEKEDT